MKIIGQRQDAPLSFHASGKLLKEGARFNDELHGLPTGAEGFIPKGVYHFRTHAEADAHAQQCLAEHMARVAARRS